jgi:hypothetical protein
VLHSQVELQLKLLRASSMLYEQFIQQAGQLEHLIQQLHAAQKLEQQLKQQLKQLNRRTSTRRRRSKGFFQGRPSTRFS